MARRDEEDHGCRSKARLANKLDFINWAIKKAQEESYTQFSLASNDERLMELIMLRDDRVANIKHVL